MEVQNKDFRKLSKWESAILILGSILMVVGIGFFVTMYNYRPISGLVFFLGSLCFAVQCMQAYRGNDLTIRRLKNIMNLANLMFILAGVFMLDTGITYQAVVVDPLGNHHRFLSAMFSNWETYQTYIYNKWLPLLLIGVVLELYTTHRISSELAKKSKTSL